jgi:hypothetical protein
MEKKSHDLGLFRLGKGIVKFDRFDENGLPTGLRDLGNVPSLTITPTEEVIEHYTSREGTKVLDTIIPVSIKATFKFTLEEFDRENLRMALFGSTGSWAIHGLTSFIVEGLLDFWPTNEQGPKYHLQVWKARLRPTGDIGLIDDTALGKLDFEFVAQNDAANHPPPASPYFDYTLIGES